MPKHKIEIKNTDCLKGLQKLKDGEIDLAFADPPFNIGYDYDVYDDRLDSDKYLHWCGDWMSEVVRVLKPTGTLWLAIGDDYAAELKVLMQRELGLVCRSWVIWYYTFGVNCKRKFSRSHTHLFHMVKDPKEFTFNNNDIRVPSARQLVYGDRRAAAGGRLPDDTWILRPQDAPDSFRLDQDTWYYPRVAGTFKERQGFHGCQMPEQILGRIIRVSCNSGETVLDPFVCSGTTAAVAKKLDRGFVGFELSEEYAQKARTRIDRIKAGDPLEGPEDPILSAPSTANGRRLDSKTSKTKTSAEKKKPSLETQAKLPGIS